MTKLLDAPMSQLRLHAWVFSLSILLDQLTKWWARARFAGPNGELDHTNYIAVIGDWVHFRLVYNFGAAFGMNPQAVISWLNPVWFFALFTVVAIILLGLYYRSLGRHEGAMRLGVVFILSGAVGNNLIDRLTLHKVTDFIDVGIPGVSPRFPVFNIADTAVTVGVLLLFLAPFLTRKKSTAAPETAADESSHAL